MAGPLIADQRAAARGQRIYAMLLAVTAGVIMVIPAFGSNYTKTFVMQGLMSCALAGSWNLISGFTGYVSFGHAAFFGIGSYAAGIAIVHGGIPPPSPSQLPEPPPLRSALPSATPPCAFVGRTLRLECSVSPRRSVLR